MEPADYSQFVRYISARDTLALQLELANAGYVEFSEGLKRKYRIPKTRGMTVHPETHLITSEPKES